MTRLAPLVLLALAAGAAGCAADSSPAPLTETVQVSGGILEGVLPDAEDLPRWPRYAAAADEALVLDEDIRVERAINDVRIDLFDEHYASVRGPGAASTSR